MPSHSQPRPPIGFGGRPPIIGPAQPPFTAMPLPPPIRGFADLHSHQFGNLGFGGRAVHGSPFGAAAAAALSSCKGATGARPRRQQ